MTADSEKPRVRFHRSAKYARTRRLRPIGTFR